MYGFEKCIKIFFFSAFISLIMHHTMAQAQISVPKNDQIEVKKEDKFTYSHSFYREKKIINKDKQQEITREVAKQTIPGEQLVGVATYHYMHTEPTDNIVLTLPLPKEVIYVKGSATDKEFIWFSVDNGQSWHRHDKLYVTKSDDTQRIATASDITHLQWRMAQNLKKGDKRVLEYKIIIR